MLFFYFRVLLFFPSSKSLTITLLPFSYGDHLNAEFFFTVKAHLLENFSRFLLDLKFIQSNFVLVAIYISNYIISYCASF